MLKSFLDRPKWTKIWFIYLLHAFTISTISFFIEEFMWTRKKNIKLALSQKHDFV